MREEEVKLTTGRFTFEEDREPHDGQYTTFLCVASGNDCACEMNRRSLGSVSLIHGDKGITMSFDEEET